jgi:hypothetical protein
MTTFFTTFVASHEIRPGDTFRGRIVASVDHLHLANGIQTTVCYIDGNHETIAHGWSYRVIRSRA